MQKYWIATIFRLKLATKKQSFWGWGWVGGLMTILCHLAPNEKMQRGIFRRWDMKCKDIFGVAIWPQCVVFVLVFDELGMQIMKFFHWHQLKEAWPKEMFFLFRHNHKAWSFKIKTSFISYCINAFA